MRVDGGWAGLGIITPGKRRELGGLTLHPLPLAKRVGGGLHARPERRVAADQEARRYAHGTGDGDEGGRRAGEGEEGGGRRIARQRARSAEWKGGQIGVLARLQRSDPVEDTEGARPAGGRQLEGGGSGEGVGEGGVAGAPGAVLTAVNDAHAPLGARVPGPPLTPDRVLAALGTL